jgi:hypothetical protein
MRAARAAAHATDRQSRALVAAGLVPRVNLDAADVLALRALAAIDGLPESRPAPAARQRAVADEARRAYPLATREWTLLVWADDARTATDPGRQLDLLAAHPGQVVLLLPIGAWAHALTHASFAEPSAEPSTGRPAGPSAAVSGG